MSKWSWYLPVLRSFKKDSSHREKLVSGDAEFVRSAQGITGPSDQHEESLQLPQKHQKQNHSIRECCNSSKAKSSASNAANRLYWHPSSESMSFITHSWGPLCHLPGCVTPPPPSSSPALGDALTLGATHLLFLSPHLLYHNIPCHTPVVHHFHC